ncbi:uncharacterized protein SETTUDRAFT_35980 [Exserohilum turcica Et28A]|uniref:Uncharacterized protein n=1 Tax=Exserohilum turcicum (strain 28A) TaxID=671987 RepID=R0I6I3_EXST2|nr:uncharacterized protein SETTUDRAFT_35980 [Exserohilum turcica Et28A]EOA81106.1 hypothetical protein SETTUDRAFT_35980 [Exserohilum turcica Et28A]
MAIRQATIEVIGQHLKAGEEEEGTMDDIKVGLTLEQAEFLAFLASLMALASEAAALWREVAQGKLPIWTASTLTDILLREAESLIHVTRLLNEEEELSSELLRPWTASTSNKDGVSQPQLAQDWVDALDKANDAGSLWRELATLLPGLPYCAMSFLRPSVNAAPDVLRSAHRPYVFTMLCHGIRHIGMGDHPTSVAQVPLVTLVATHFCLLVTSKGVDLEAARTEVRAELSGILALLPRLYKQKALTEKEINEFRNTAKGMKAWAEACTEPMSLGTIHAFARMHWVQWYVRIIGTNSLPLQTFLYLCEKRRLQASGDIDDDNDDKRLIGALLEDQRIAPYLLQDGRPKTVSQCIKALRDWCHLPTLDGRTLNDKYIRQLETSERMKRLEVVESISSARSINSMFMYERITNNNYRVTKDMYIEISARLPVEERRNGLTDPTLLRRYLIWEMDPPSCFDLEAALFEAVQKTPEWEGLRVVSLLRLIPDKSNWWNEVAKVLRQALEAKLPGGFFIVNDDNSLQIALLKAALRVNGHEESLKAALISAIRHARVAGNIPHF